MEAQVGAFLTWLTDERGAAANTIAAYRKDLEQFSAFIGPETDPNEVCDEQILSFLTYLGKLGYSLSSSTRKLSAIRSFFDHLHDYQVVRRNPAFWIRYSSITRARFLVIRPADLDQLERVLRREKDPLTTRDLAIISLISRTKLPVQPLLGLDVSDLDFRTCSIRVRTWNHPEGILQTGSKVWRDLHVYLSEARPRLLRGAAEPSLFVNFERRRLSRESLLSRLKGYGGLVPDAVIAALFPGTTRKKDGSKKGG